jgi:hypothetical protein
MATTYWDKILPLVTPDIPGCPEESIKTALAAISADFCARTHLWRTDIEDQTTVIDQALYEVTDCAVIESVLWVLVDDKELVHIDERNVRKEDLDRKGVPTHFWVVDDTQIRLFPIPDSELSIEVRVALKPSRTAKGVESWIYETWADVLASGAVYRLARVPGKEWSNPDLAAMHKNLYEQGVTNARIRDLRNVQKKVQMRPFNGAKYGRR